MKLYKNVLLRSTSLLMLLMLFACAGGYVPNQTIMKALNNDDKALNLFENIFEEELAASPEYQTYLGRKNDYGKWDERTVENEKAAIRRAKSHVVKLLKIPSSTLSSDVKVSYDLMLRNLNLQIEGEKWVQHSYPVNQMFGVHTSIPSFLINQHRIETIKDANDYISRVVGVKKLLTQVSNWLIMQNEMGVVLPKFLFEKVKDPIPKITTGLPFDDGKENPLYADFKNKIAKLNLSNNQMQRLLSQLSAAMNNEFKAGYDLLLATLEQVSNDATSDAGVWKLPDGQEFYKYRLLMSTTTDMNAREIHNLGQSEVLRIHNEMRKLMRTVGYVGTLKGFFKFMKENPQFYYENTDEGRAAYLKKAKDIIDNMKDKMDLFFSRKPKADIIVKRVEPFRENASGTAFYQRPSEDGSRPGTYYANLKNMKDMPKYQMEALAYHEGIPGHHMQIAMTQELETLPSFRRFGGITAYVEGWGLYSEYLPKEMGMYQDPYSDFGRLAMELWRATRLVVDTGIHEMKWTREQAINYLTENTPESAGEINRAVDRYVVMPGQATAYKIGMLKILELRENSKRRLGKKFSLKEFHTRVLDSGPVPLAVLENLIDEWIVRTLAN